jgi:hypothetical protein
LEDAEMKFSASLVGLVMLSLGASMASAQILAPVQAMRGVRSLQVGVSLDDTEKYLNEFNVKAGIESKLRARKFAMSANSDYRLWVDVIGFEDQGLLYYIVHTAYTHPADFGLRQKSGELRFRPARAVLWDTISYGTVGRARAANSLTEIIHEHTDQFLVTHARVNSGFTGEPVQDPQTSAENPYRYSIAGISAVRVVAGVSDVIKEVFPQSRLQSIAEAKLSAAGIPVNLGLPTVSLSLNALERGDDWAYALIIKVFRPVTINHQGKRAVTDGWGWRTHHLGRVRKGYQTEFDRIVGEQLDVLISDYRKQNPQ